MKKLKNSKLNDAGYYSNAAKLIRWPLNIEERVIYVPENELNQAKDNLTVSHLCNAEHRFHIQSTIPDGVVMGKDEIEANFKARIRHEEDSNGMIGREFLVKSDGAILQIIKEIGKDNYEMAYKNRPKVNFPCNLVQIKKQCDIGSWKGL